MTPNRQSGSRRPRISSRLSLTALALVAAAGLLPESEAHAQMNMGVPAVANQTYDPAAAARAKASLQAYFAAVGGDVAGGENLSRFFWSSGSMMWHDAETLEMVLDYYEATVAAGAPDTSFNYVVQNYKGYNPIEPFSLAQYADPRQNQWWGWVLDPLAMATEKLTLDPAVAAMIQWVSQQTHNAVVIDPYNLNVVNISNDDLLWWALTFIRAYDDFQDPAYLATAENVFKNVCLQWNVNTDCGGGVIWGDHGSTGLGAITNELFFQTATKLALRDSRHDNVCGLSPGVAPTGRVQIAEDFSGYYPCQDAPPRGLQCFSASLPDTYQGWAYAEYQWFNQDYPMATGLLQNGFDVGTCNLVGKYYTYNQGPIIGALADLSLMAANGTGIGAYLDPTLAAQILPEAEAIALQVMQPRTPDPNTFGLTVTPPQTSDLNSFGLMNGILTEQCDAPFEPGCGYEVDTANDTPQFKGILARYLGHFASTLAASGSGSTTPVDYNNPPFPTSDLGVFSYHIGQFLKANSDSISAHTLSPLVLPENWSVDPGPQPYTSSQLQPMTTSGLDAIIAAMWLPNEPTCQGGSNCGDTCCASDGSTTCTSKLVCCPAAQVTSAGTCCPPDTTASGSSCCGINEVECGGACVARSNLCGSLCGCPTGEICFDPSNSVCAFPTPCGADQLNCGTFCCAGDQQCQDTNRVGCCGGAEGPQCMIGK